MTGLEIGLSAVLAGMLAIFALLWAKTPKPSGPTVVPKPSALQLQADTELKVQILADKAFAEKEQAEKLAGVARDEALAAHQAHLEEGAAALEGDPGALNAYLKQVGAGVRAQ